MNTLPRVLLISTGGTITMTPGASGGVVPTLTGEDLVRSVPALADVCDLAVESFATKPGASLTLHDLNRIAGRIDDALAGGTAGVIMVQGTDTIEETAFVLDLLVQSDKPVVVTGAMRSAAAPGADGPANLLAAAITAASGEAVGRGTMVVLNDEIHAARHVQKTDTSSTGTFCSPGIGPLGRVLEGAAVFFHPASRTAPLPPAAEPLPCPVALVKVGLDDDGRLLPRLSELGYGGAVIEAMGAGHLPSWYAERINELVQQMPVVLATRVPAGPIFRKTYSFPGSEMDSLSRGALWSGLLASTKARLLLTLLLTRGCSGKTLREAFEGRATLPRTEPAV